MNLEKMRKYNVELEASEAYKNLMPAVEREVASAVVTEEIERLEEMKEPKLAASIAKLKALLDEDPLKAADAMNGFGRCHSFWRWQKKILSEKYGIVWYSPDELNPDICFD